MIKMSHHHHRHHDHHCQKSEQNKLCFICSPLQICDYGNERALQHQSAHSAVAPHRQHNRHRADQMLIDKCTDVLPTTPQ